VDDQGRAYRQTVGAGTLGDGWYSFDTHGVHFIALVNTLSLEKLGHLGQDQIDFVRKDVAGLSSVTPLNGHVHQLFTRVEGNVTFHSATTTAYPLPKPGKASAPTPQVLPAG